MQIRPYVSLLDFLVLDADMGPVPKQEARVTRKDFKCIEFSPRGYLLRWR
jgi:hypothetical protein